MNIPTKVAGFVTRNATVIRKSLALQRRDSV